MADSDRKDICPEISEENLSNTRTNSHMSAGYHPGFDFVARELGYADLHDLARCKGYESPLDMVQERGFENIPRFFNAPDAYNRIQNLRRK